MTTVSREIWRSLHAEELAANNEKWHIAGHPDLRIKICPDEVTFCHIFTLKICSLKQKKLLACLIVNLYVAIIPVRNLESMA